MDTKYFTKEELENILETYIKDKHDNLAVMLNGEWGSGKTYFINGFKQKLEKDKKYNNKYNIVYLSMYGITSLEDIKQKFLTAFFKKNIERLRPENEDKVFSKWKYMTNTLLDFVGSDSFIKYSSFFLNNTDVSIPALGGLGIGKGFLENLKDLPDYENTILIIDDFERSSIDVVELLGYINSLVEHGKYKVIIVANEKEIDSMFSNRNLETKISALLSSSNSEKYFEVEGENKFPSTEKIYNDVKKYLNKNIMYQEIKEKTIGRTIKFNISSEDVIRSIISTRGISEYMLNNNYIEEIEYIFSFLGCNIKNFRTIEFALNSYSYFVDKLTKVIKDADLLSREKEILFKYVLAKAIMIKHPDLSTEFEKKRTNSGRIYMWRDGRMFVDEFMEQGLFDEERFTEIYRTKEKEYTYTKNLSFYTINTDDMIFLSEQEIIDICNMLCCEIKQERYPFNMYSNIINRLFFIKKDMKIELELLEVIKKMHELVQRASWNELLKTSFRIPDDVEDQEEMELLEKIKNKMRTSNEDRISIELNEIIAERNIDKLILYVKENQSKFAGEYVFMKAFSDDDLKYIIKESDSKQMYNLGIAIYGVYSFENIKQFFSGDLDAIENFLKLLKEQINIPKLDKARKYILSGVVNALEIIEQRLS